MTRNAKASSIIIDGTVYLNKSTHCKGNGLNNDASNNDETVQETSQTKVLNPIESQLIRKL